MKHRSAISFKPGKPAARPPTHLDIGVADEATAALVCCLDDELPRRHALGRVAVQRLVHGKTPFDIVSEAYRINQERENRKKLPVKAIPLQPAAGQPPAAGAAPTKPFDDLP